MRKKKRGMKKKKDMKKNFKNIKINKNYYPNMHQTYNLKLPINSHNNNQLI